MEGYVASVATSSQISEAQFQRALQTFALHVSRDRKAGVLYDLSALDYKVPSTDEEMKRDWHNATVFMATTALMATVLRLSDLEEKCYPCIEGVWLGECKENIAYFLWMDARDEVGVWYDLHVQQNHYFEACARIRNLLVERRSKDRLENFGPIRDYICGNYLDEYQRIDNGEHSDKLIQADRKSTR